MSHPKYMRIRNSRNPEDYYIWTEQLAGNQDLESYDGALPPRISKKGEIVQEAPVAESPPVIQTALEQLQEMIGTPEPEKTEPATGEGNERLAAIRSVIPALDPETDFAKPGPVNGNVATPKVAAVSAKLGYKVTFEEIKAAMQE